LPIYEFSQSGIVALKETAFSSVNMYERRDLQRLLRDNVEVIAPDTLVISEEFGEWEEARRRIDLLGVDRDANLVVIELKRTEDGGHIELQSIRYASMVSTMTFDRAAEVFGRYPAPLGRTCLALSKQSSHREENHGQTTPGQRDGALVARGHSA
jgi:RecB family endonuclease NucS